MLNAPCTAAIAFAELGDAKLVLTDELIAESLKRGGRAAADGAEVDVTDGDAPDGDDEKD